MNPCPTRFESSIHAGLDGALGHQYFGLKTATLLLRIVDVGAMTESAEVFVAYPTARASAKLRALVDWLRRAFGTPPHWEILARQ